MQRYKWHQLQKLPERRIMSAHAFRTKVREDAISLSKPVAKFNSGASQHMNEKNTYIDEIFSKPHRLNKFAELSENIRALREALRRSRQELVAAEDQLRRDGKGDHADDIVVTISVIDKALAAGG